jgi:hypothetical protein
LRKQRNVREAPTFIKSCLVCHVVGGQGSGVGTSVTLVVTSLHLGRFIGRRRLIFIPMQAHSVLLGFRHWKVGMVVVRGRGVCLCISTQRIQGIMCSSEGLCRGIRVRATGQIESPIPTPPYHAPLRPMQLYLPNNPRSPNTLHSCAFKG